MDWRECWEVDKTSAQELLGSCWIDTQASGGKQDRHSEVGCQRGLSFRDDLRDDRHDQQRRRVATKPSRREHKRGQEYSAVHWKKPSKWKIPKVTVIASLFPHPCQKVIMASSLGATAFMVFGVLSVVTLKELNTQVTEPYMVSHAGGTVVA